MNVLISVGNDGYVHCRAMDHSDPLKWEVTSLDLLKCRNVSEGKGDIDSSTTRRKITSLCIVRGESKRAVIAIGTSCGQIELVEITKLEDSTVRASFLTDREAITVSGLEDGEGKVIHALCSSRYDDFSRIIIGHSGGLSVSDINI